MFRRFFTNSITRAKIYAQTKREKSKLTKIRICVPGETEDNKLSADTALKDETSIAASFKKVMKWSYLKGVSSGEPKEDGDVKSVFPPPIDLTVNQDKRVVKAVSYDKLRKKKYFVDKSDLIRDIYEDEVDAKYYCFPRAGTKSTVVSSLVHWLQYNDATRAERLKCFEGTKIMDLAKEADGTVKDGAIGFNRNIIIRADFARVEIENLTFEEIKTEVTKEFCRFLRRQYSLSSVVETELMNLKASDSRFFDEIVNLVLPQTIPDSVKRSVLLIIDNFDAPALRILNREKSTELALKVMGFFSLMLGDVTALDDRFFTKILLFGTHQPIGMNTKSVLKKIPVETYPYGTKEICTKFFFSTEDVKTVLKNSGEDESLVTELAKICGGYNIDDEDYFHPGCIINYITRQQRKHVSSKDPVYWCSVDSLDILADTAITLPYEMTLWTLEEDQFLDFKYEAVLVYENFKGNPNIAYTYFLEGGYLTRVKGTHPPKYKIVNAEARNLFIARYKQWQQRIPTIFHNIPLCRFETEDYDGFFDVANDILKRNYAGEDFKYEGQYHVFLGSFFHCNPGWYFKSNNQDGYGKSDFIVWNKNPLSETGYVFEIAKVKTCTNPKKQIESKITEKIKQVEANEYISAVEKKKKKCIIVVGYRKMLSYAIYDIN